MSTYDEHLIRARHNEELATRIPDGFADWRIVVTFYAAVHYVEAIVVHNGRRSSDHRSRKEALNAIPELRPAAVDYNTLANQTWIARYRADYDFNDPALRTEVKRTCDLLGAIKAALRISA